MHLHFEEFSIKEQVVIMMNSWMVVMYCLSANHCMHQCDLLTERGKCCHHTVILDPSVRFREEAWFMKTRNNKGPKMLPCEITDNMGVLIIIA